MVLKWVHKNDILTLTLSEGARESILTNFRVNILQPTTFEMSPTSTSFKISNPDSLEVKFWLILI